MVEIRVNNLQLAIEIPTPTIWGRYFCPNCGKEGKPEERIRCEENISFWNCKNDECDFSSWNIADYEKPRNILRNVYLD